MIIYKATNKINGKVYIGQTIQTLKARKSKHKSCVKNKKFTWHFYNSIRRYGWDNFKWQIIDTAKTINELNKKEEYWIKQYKATNERYGYNKFKGGNNMKMPQSVKNKISKANKGRVFTEEWIKNMSESRKGRVHSIGWRLEMSLRMQGRVFTEEHKKRMADAERGEKNHQAKLTEKDVIEIKTRIKNGETNPSIAKDFPVSHKMISLIRTGKSWRHVII